MAIRKQTFITLLVPEHGIEQEFEIRHAERLLQMGTRANGGWIIPTDSKYYYDTDNGIRIKPDKGDTEKTNEA